METEKIEISKETYDKLLEFCDNKEIVLQSWLEKQILLKLEGVSKSDILDLLNKDDENYTEFEKFERVSVDLIQDDYDKLRKIRLAKYFDESADEHLVYGIVDVLRRLIREKYESIKSKK